MSLNKRMLSGFACAVIASSCLNAIASEASNRRTAERQARSATLKSLPELRKKALTPSVQALAAVGQWLAGIQAKSDAEKIISDIEALDRQYAGLEKLMKSVSEVQKPITLDEPKTKELATRMKTVQRAKSTGLLELARNFYSIGLSRHAFDMTQEVLETDPDNPAARQAMGHVRTPDGWKESFAAAQVQKGNTYVPDLGWVPAQAAERVLKGEWYENGRWMTLDEADKLHGRVNTPWVIESQNFMLKSTAPRKKAVEFSERLEGIRQLCYREFLEFFVRGSGKRQELLFTHSTSRKMAVQHFGEKPDYDTVIKKEYKGRVQAFLLTLPGVYIPQVRMAYFTETDLPADLIAIFVHDQMTKQILSEYAQGGLSVPKPWINHGLGVVLHYAVQDENKKWAIAQGSAHRAVTNTQKQLATGILMDLQTLLSLNPDQFEAQVGENTDPAGAFALFLLETRERAWAMDFLDMAYDSFKGLKITSIQEYLGTDTAGLEKEYHKYITGSTE